MEERGENAGICPKCGSPLVWRRARLTGELYRGCTNYGGGCRYQERSYQRTPPSLRQQKRSYTSRERPLEDDSGFLGELDYLRGPDDSHFWGPPLEVKAERGREAKEKKSNARADTFGKWIRFWRERYCWPRSEEDEPSEEEREASEKRIRQIENQMRIGILKGLPYDIKKDLGEAILWKAGPSHQEEMIRLFDSNTEEALLERIGEVFSILSKNPNDVVGAMGLLVKIKGVGIPVASAILRFFDPANHRYGVIDTNVARFLNENKITSFELDEQNLIKKYPSDVLKRNIGEYQKYHNWLQQVSLLLRERNVTYRNIDKTQKPFQPVDIDMAIFAYMTQTRSKH